MKIYEPEYRGDRFRIYIDKKMNPWFCCVDILRILDIPRDFYKLIDIDERLIILINKRKYVYMKDSGVNELIFRYQKDFELVKDSNGG